MTKSTIQIQEVNCTTGEEVFRDATAEELNQIELDKMNDTKQKEAKAKAASDKAALLAQLGITEEQAKLLLG